MPKNVTPPPQLRLLISTFRFVFVFMYDICIRIKEGISEMNGDKMSKKETLSVNLIQGFSFYVNKHLCINIIHENWKMNYEY